MFLERGSKNFTAPSAAEPALSVSLPDSIKLRCPVGQRPAVGLAASESRTWLFAHGEVEDGAAAARHTDDVEALVRPTTKGEPMEAHGHGLAIVYEKRRPAMSTNYEPGSFFLVFNADADLENDSTDGAEPVCLHCLIEDGDEQLARGLDMARVHLQADFDPDADEWVVPCPHPDGPWFVDRRLAELDTRRSQRGPKPLLSPFWIEKLVGLMLSIRDGDPPLNETARGRANVVLTVLDDMRHPEVFA